MSSLKKPAFDYKAGFENFLTTFRDNGERVYFISVFSRAGSFFFQSLLDNHPQVDMFPGNLSFYPQLAKKIQAKESWENQTKKMLQDTFHPANTGIFKLGEKGNTTLPLEPDSVIGFLKEIFDGSQPSSKELFLALTYVASVLTKKAPVSGHTVVMHNHHLINELDQQTLNTLLSDFPNLKLIVPVRDPRSVYVSITQQVRGKIPRQFPQSHFIFLTTIQHTVSGLAKLDLFPNRTIFLKLEEAQFEREHYIKRLANAMNLKFESSLLETTFGGLVWGGHDDKSSPRQSGFRSSASKERWKKGLSWYRGNLVEFLLEPEIKALGYEPYYRPNLFERWMLLFSFPLWLWEDYRKFFFPTFYLFMWRQYGESSSSYRPRPSSNFRTRSASSPPSRVESSQKAQI